MSIGEGSKFPIMGFGRGWDRGVVGDFTLELKSSGLVGTCYGMPGVSATLIGTGLYDIRFPTTAIRGARFYPRAEAPTPLGPTGAQLPGNGSGAVPQFDVAMSHVGGQSGSAYLNTFSTSPTPTAVGGATGVRLINPPTGSVINVQVFGSPVTRY